MYLIVKHNLLILGITHPSPEAQRNLLTKVYCRAKVDPKSVSYIEAHSTGTPVGDPIELNTIADVMTEGREGPLLVGAVKSNMGHTEAVSGMFIMFLLLFIITCCFDIGLWFTCVAYLQLIQRKLFLIVL